MADFLKKALGVAVLAPLAFSPARAGTGFWNKLEVGLSVGLALPRPAAVSAYRDDWSLKLLKNVSEETVVSPERERAPSFRVSLARFFRPELGLEAGFSFAGTGVPNRSAFRLSYVWADGLEGTIGGDWEGTGRLCSLPVFLNAIWRPVRNRFQLRLSAGPALFFNSARASATVGIGLSDETTIWVYVPPAWTSTTVQHIDAVAADLKIPKTAWTSVGFNAGLGIGCALGPRLAAGCEIRIFRAPARDIPWTVTPGTYDGLTEAGSRWIVSASLARDVESRASDFRADPSHVQVSAGLKLSFR